MALLTKAQILFRCFFKSLKFSVLAVNISSAIVIYQEFRDAKNH